jgi:voltage-gated potassium channel
MPSLSSTEAPSRDVRGRYWLLFVGSILLIAVQPTLEPGPATTWVLSGLRTTVLLGGIIAVWRDRRLSAVAAVVIVGVALVTLAADWVTGWQVTTIATEMLVFLALGLIGVVIFRDIVRSTHVSTDTLFAAACVYLVLGLWWSKVHLLLEWWQPGSYVPGLETGLSLKEVSRTFLYFSFVTLSTLGYGDVLPIHPSARNLAALEAITGQLYVAILIGLLVGLRMRNAR